MVGSNRVEQGSIISIPVQFSKKKKAYLEKYNRNTFLKEQYIAVNTPGQVNDSNLIWSHGKNNHGL